MLAIRCVSHSLPVWDLAALVNELARYRKTEDAHPDFLFLDSLRRPAADPLSNPGRDLLTSYFEMRIREPIRRPQNNGCLRFPRFCLHRAILCKSRAHILVVEEASENPVPEKA
jgi:hypothetical protein